jgi:acyl-coenzyme A thioesterase PaaI-like protein
MRLSCELGLEQVSALTVSLSVDFLSVERIGQWIKVRATPAKLGRTLALADARIDADGLMITKAAATFRIVEVPAPPG